MTEYSVYNATSGENILSASKNAISLANSEKSCIIFTFNDININVYPESFYIDIMEKYSLYYNIRRNT